MSLPPYLADLPPLSDLISKIEDAIMLEDEQPYGNWVGQPLFSDENMDPWTQKQWFRYEDFMEAGRDYGNRQVPYLSTPEHQDKDIPPGAEDEGQPFSPLAMVAALDLCGYKQRPITPDRIRLLCRALGAAAKADLEGLFAAPEGLLTHILNYSIHHQDEDEPVENRCYGGAKAADALRDAIIGKVHALATWPGIVELLDQVDWNDESVLMDLASDPACAKDNSSNPLCDIMYQVDCHEGVSATRLRILFQEWALQQIPPTTERPAFYKKTFPVSDRDQVSERVLHAKSLIGMDRFQRAIVRICRPTLHPQVPPQISLLNFEMLLRENPRRISKLSEPLLAAIGYHYTVVHIHYMLRKLIFDKASAAPGWQGRTVDKMSGKPPVGSPQFEILRRDTIDTAYSRLIPLNMAHNRAKPTLRDARLYRISYYFPPINWANYLSIDLESLPRTIALDGPKLKTTLDMACYKTYGCLLSELMDAWFQTVGRFSVSHDFQVYPEQESDVAAGFQALEAGKHDPAMREIAHCLYSPDPRPHRERGLASGRTLLPPVRGSAPLAQSSHSYLRDNPPLLRPTERIIAEEDPAPSPVEVEQDEDAPRFHVNSAQMKVVERLFGKREGLVRWSQLINLFRRIGFRAEGMGGSAFHITPILPGGLSILLYRPHPEPSFSPDQTAAVGAQIASTFGWSVDNFVRQGEAKGNSPEPHAD